MTSWTKTKGWFFKLCRVKTAMEKRGGGWRGRHATVSLTIGAVLLELKNIKDRRFKRSSIFEYWFIGSILSDDDRCC